MFPVDGSAFAAHATVASEEEPLIEAPTPAKVIEKSLLDDPRLLAKARAAALPTCHCFCRPAGGDPAFVSLCDLASAVRNAKESWAWNPDPLKKLLIQMFEAADRYLDIAAPGKLFESRCDLAERTADAALRQLSELCEATKEVPKAHKTATPRDFFRLTTIDINIDVEIEIDSDDEHPAGAGERRYSAASLAPSDSPTQNERPGAGSKKRPLPSLTMTLPAYRRPAALSTRAISSARSEPHVHARLPRRFSTP
jgi:hypothetical protein